MIEDRPLSIIFITYDPENGYVIPDGKVKKAVHQFLLRTEKVIDEYTLTVGSGLFIDYIRLAIKSGRIDPENITFCLLEKGDRIKADHKGNFQKLPKGYFSYYEKVLQKLKDNK